MLTAGRLQPQFRAVLGVPGLHDSGCPDDARRFLPSAVTVARRLIPDTISPPDRPMLRFLRVIFSDFAGLARVCGLGVALRWLAMIAINFPSCLRQRNLQPADRAMGPGPFTARLGTARARLFGDQAISGIREIWVRDVYLDRGRLTIPPDGVVVDLGANMGNFTMLALGHGAKVRCVSVEGDPRSVEKLQANLHANGWLDRAELCTQFIGGKTAAQEQLEREIGTAGGQPQFIPEDEFVRRYNLQRIDLLKCDIEGSEFGLLTRHSLLLRMAEQLAVEVHAWGGDMKAFCRMLEEVGFRVHVGAESANDMIVQATRRGVPQPAARPIAPDQQAQPTTPTTTTVSSQP